MHRHHSRGGGDWLGFQSHVSRRSLAWDCSSLFPNEYDCPDDQGIHLANVGSNASAHNWYPFSLG